jgi:hypothetical protein
MAQEEPANPLADFTDFKYGKYMINGQLMIIIVNSPMMSTRLDLYGNIINERGQSIINTKTESKVTKKGKDIYDRLITMKSVGDLWAFKVVMLGHDRVTIVAYLSTDLEKRKDEILKVFGVLK